MTEPMRPDEIPAYMEWSASRIERLERVLRSTYEWFNANGHLIPAGIGGAGVVTRIGMVLREGEVTP